eukprot:2199856-Amphidinium_carterae.1
MSTCVCCLQYGFQRTIAKPERFLRPHQQATSRKALLPCQQSRDDFWRYVVRDWAKTGRCEKCGTSSGSQKMSTRTETKWKQPHQEALVRPNAFATQSGDSEF